MKKVIISIMTLCLAVSVVTPEVAFAQDDVYMTPTRAKKMREKLSQERAKRMQRVKEEQAAREKRSAQYIEDVDDWYNRRQMKVTVEEMEQNLERLEGAPTNEDSRTQHYDVATARTSKGGKYSQRLRRFSNEGDMIVLENVDKVYMLDDMDYNPWTNTYYGRDWQNGVNISINMDSYYPYHRYNWGYTPYAWGYSYDPWLVDPWYSDPWYRSSWAWGYPRYYGWGWRYASPWGGYHRGYWDGYCDAHYDYGYYAPIYSTGHTYSSYGRSVGTEYDRNAHNEIYGRALGNSSRSISYSDTYNRSAMRSGDYDRAITIHSDTSRRSTRNDGSGMWNRGRTYEHSGSSYSGSAVHSSTTRSSGSYGGSVSSGGSSNRSSGGATGRSSSASRRGR